MNEKCMLACSLWVYSLRESWFIARLWRVQETEMISIHLTRSMEKDNPELPSEFRKRMNPSCSVDFASSLQSVVFIGFENLFRFSGRGFFLMVSSLGHLLTDMLHAYYRHRSHDKLNHSLSLFHWFIDSNGTSAFLRVFWSSQLLFIFIFVTIFSFKFNHYWHIICSWKVLLNMSD